MRKAYKDVQEQQEHKAREAIQVTQDRQEETVQQDLKARKAYKAFKELQAQQEHKAREAIQAKQDRQDPRVIPR